MMLRKSVATLLVLAAVTGCGGGSHGLIPSQGSTTPVAPSQRKAPALITITWPKKSVATKRHPQFVSPSTMSVVVEVSGSDGSSSTTIANNNGSKPTTTLNIDAAVGSDTFVVSLWDQKQQTGETTPVGNELGTATVTAAIAAGKTNTVNFTVDGVVSALAVAIPSPGPMESVSGTAGSQAIKVIGDAPRTVTLTPLDADGNAIITAATAPTYSLSTGGATGNAISISPGSQPNEFTIVPKGLQPDWPMPSNASLVLAATATDDVGPHTTNITINPLNEVFVGYANGAGSKVAAFDGNGNPIALPSGAFSGITQPLAMTYDPDDRWALVADASGKVLAFDTSGNPISGFNSPTFSGLTSIAYYNDKSGRNGTSPLPAPSQRVLVARTNGFFEIDLTGNYIPGVASGTTQSSGGTSFTPTAIAGVISQNGPANGGAMVVVPNPIDGTVDGYDMNNPSGGALNASWGHSIPGGDTIVDFSTFVAADASGAGCSANTSLTFILAATSNGNVDYFSANCSIGIAQGIGYAGLAYPSFSIQQPVGSAVAAVAPDIVNGGYYAAEPSANAVVDYSVANFSSPTQITTSFTAPAGLSNPTALAVAF